MKEPVGKSSKDKSKAATRTVKAAPTKSAPPKSSEKSAGGKVTNGGPRKARETAPIAQDSARKQPQTMASPKKDLEKQRGTGKQSGKAESPANTPKPASPKSAPAKSSPKAASQPPVKSINKPSSKSVAKAPAKGLADKSGGGEPEPVKTAKPAKAAPSTASAKAKTAAVQPAGKSPTSQQASQQAPKSPATGAVKAPPAKKPKAKTAPAAPRMVAEPVPVQPPVIKVEPTHRQPSATAVKVFEQAIKVFHKRQFGEAKALFENILTKYPHEVEILARSTTYIHVCEQRLAHEETLPRKPEDLYDRGVFSLNTGNYDQARVCFEKALKIKPDEPHILYSLAATLVNLGQTESALVHLQRSMQLQPRYRSQVLNDADFSDLRDNRQFLSMMGMTSPFDRLETRR